MGNIKDRRDVAVLTVRGREFRVERIAWKDSAGLSFDVHDVATDQCLTAESFDNQPGAAEVETLLDRLKDDAAAGRLGGFFDDEESGENLARILGVRSDGAGSGGLAARLTADEIECALTTLADLCKGVDEDDLSDYQRTVAVKVLGLVDDGADDDEAVLTIHVYEGVEDLNGRVGTLEYAVPPHVAVTGESDASDAAVGVRWTYPGGETTVIGGFPATSGRMYARLTDSGTAAAETAVCGDHIAKAPSAADAAGALVDCTGNEALTCTVCGAV